MRAFITCLLCLSAAAGIWTSSRMHAPLIELRTAQQVSVGDPLEGTTPLVAFTTIAMGGFRGIIADVLWLRASRMQEEGKYFELVQLSDWITKLEPRFASVWAFHAWNLAYNISVMFKNPEDRWRWVRNGISLIRDEGLYYNRNDAALYHELSWLYHHKIGGVYDTAHPYYKQKWSDEIAALLDNDRPNYEALRAAPRTRDALLGDGELRALADELLAMGVDPFSLDLLDGVHEETPTAKAINDSAAGHRLVDYLRRKKIEDIYKLDLDAMQRLDDYYGPLDWRNPQVHSLYWAERGREFATGFDAIAIERIICQSMASMMKAGRHVVDPQSGARVAMARPEMYDRVKRTFAKARAMHPDVKTFREAYQNFIRQAAVMMLAYNLRDRAAVAHSDYTAEFPNEEVPAELDRFIYETFLDRSGQDKRGYVLDTIKENLFESFRWIVLGDADHAQGLSTLAELVWTKYNEDEQGSLPPNAPNPLPPFAELVEEARKHAHEVFDYPSARIRLDSATLQ